MGRATRSALWIVPTAGVLLVALYFASAVPTYRLVLACYTHGLKQPVRIWRTVYAPYVRNLQIEPLKSVHWNWVELWGDPLPILFVVEEARRKYVDHPELEAGHEMTTPCESGCCCIDTQVK